MLPFVGIHGCYQLTADESSRINSRQSGPDMARSIIHGLKIQGHDCGFLIHQERPAAEGYPPQPGATKRGK